MLVRIWCVALVMIFCALPALSEDKKAPSATALEIAKIANTKDLFMDAFMAGFSPWLSQLKKSGQVTPEKIEKIENAAKQLALKVYADPELIPSIAAVYDKYFTSAEQKELLEFYKTPLGKKFLVKMPVLFKGGADVGQRISKKYLQDFSKQVKEIMLPPAAK